MDIVGAKLLFQKFKYDIIFSGEDMKENFLNYSLAVIKNSNPSIDDVKLEEFRYGLEGFYIFITKPIIIFTLAIILNIFKEMFILFITFNILRIPGAGLHASKSSICLSSSSLIFLVLPFLLRYVVIPFNLKIIIAIIDIILIYRYAPADTKKKPIIKKERREKLKFVTTINCIILVIAFLTCKNELISNLIMAGIFVEIFMILPISYKLFHFTYNNYLLYEQ